MMRDGRTSSLLFFCFIFIKVSVSGDGMMVSEVVRARPGQRVSLSCKVGDELRVVLSEWSRCSDSSIIAVLHPGAVGDGGARVNVNETYSGLVSITDYHELTILQVQEGNFGEYCCKVTTFPKGSLEGRVQLLKEQENNRGEEVEEHGSTSTVNNTSRRQISLSAVYISCGVIGCVLLTGFMAVALLLCKKRRSKVRNPLHVTVSTSISPKQPSLLQTDSHTASHNLQRHAEDADDDMYLKVRSWEP